MQRSNDKHVAAVISLISSLSQVMIAQSSVTLHPITFLIHLFHFITKN